MNPSPDSFRSLTEFLMKHFSYAVVLLSESQIENMEELENGETKFAVTDWDSFMDLREKWIQKKEQKPKQNTKETTETKETKETKE